MSKSSGFFRFFCAGLVFLFFALNGSVTESGQTAVDQALSTAIIPAARQANWSGAGVSGSGLTGIPNRTVVFCNVKVNIPGSTLVARGDGIQDDTAALRAAIAACPVGQVVFIPGGTYRISGTLRVTKGIVVRGDGPDKTKIVQHASSNIFAISGSSTAYWTPAHSGGASSLVQPVVSGAARNSDRVVVANASAFNPGDEVILDELNDPALVVSSGVGSCNWCGLSAYGVRAMGETLVVLAKTGNSLTFNRPLYFPYQNQFQPRLVKISAGPVHYAGIENLYIESAPENSDGGGVTMSYCINCWLKNIESASTPRKHVLLTIGAVGNEVRDSYFHDARSFTSDRGYGVNINLQACDNLVENNIFYHLHFPIAIESATGNVIAYNYVERTEHYASDWYIQAMGTHSAHTYMNLWEGNVAGMIDFDNYWGSGSHQVVFRNRLTRENPGTPVANNVIAAIVDADNYYDTFVGNILGTAGCGGVVEQVPYRSTYRNPVIWKIGYRCCSATGYPRDPKTAATLIRHGNYDYITKGLTWDSTISDHNIPNSVYRSAKPTWFKSLPWPPFTPERAGFNANSLNKIPAQVCYENGPKIGLPFNPTKYYY